MCPYLLKDTQSRVSGRGRALGGGGPLTCPYLLKDTQSRVSGAGPSADVTRQPYSTLKRTLYITELLCLLL